MDLGPHAFFIVAAYAVTAAVVGALIGWAFLDHRDQQRALAAFDGRGLRRGPEGSGRAGDALERVSP